MVTIAQLIKLKDFISRYEWNIYRYPSQFIRLKQENWENLYTLWIDQKTRTTPDLPEVEKAKYPKFFSFFRPNKSAKEGETRDALLPDTEMELRHYFLNKLFPLQLKWATSTVTDISFVDQSYEEDNDLKYFLNRFPDIYLLMYYPVFHIKGATIDGEIILISPIGIEIIHLMEGPPEEKIIAGDHRTWMIESGNKRETKLSPLICLKRTEHIVKSILLANQITLPIQKVVLSRFNHIAFASEPYNTRFIGKNQYEKWFQQKRQLHSTLKSEQLKSADLLLKHCLSTSVKRPEWLEDDLFHLSTQED